MELRWSFVGELYCLSLKFKIQLRDQASLCKQHFATQTRTLAKQHPCTKKSHVLTTPYFSVRDKVGSESRARSRFFFLDILTRRPLIQPSSMAFSQPILRTLCSVLFFRSCGQALKVDLEAFIKGDSRGTRCIRNFVAKDTLVVVTATVDGTKGDGMILNMHVSSFGKAIGLGQ